MFVLLRLADLISHDVLKVSACLKSKTDLTSVTYFAPTVMHRAQVLWSVKVPLTGIAVLGLRLFQFWFPWCVYAQQWNCWVIWQFYFQCFKESTLFSMVVVLVCIPTNSVRGFPFVHTLSSLYYL